MRAQNKIELLAPAGSPEAFYGAIHAGADAVYLGGARFGARAYADNFTEEELLQCIRYAHLFGRKVYLTVNTLVKESEFSELDDFLRPYYEGGLDGVIIQDLGVFAYVRDHFPGLELHVSTQMAVTGKYSADLLKKMGACRIVPARELSLAELVEMKAATGLEIEVFIHGAMCYCYSGQCLFSSILGGRSGNRGRCAQPCRLPYRVSEAGRADGAVKQGCKQQKEHYPLSLKDLCTIEHLPALIEAGIDSFKIEGRMKKPEYTAGVTAIYRKYIDAWYVGSGRARKEPVRISEEDLQLLSSLYIRSERQDGYFYKQNGKEMVTLESPAYSGAKEDVLAKLRETYITNRPSMTIRVQGKFVTGKPASVSFILGALSVTAAGEVVQEAKNAPITMENVKKQLGKLGDSIFSAENIEVEISDNAFYPLKQINELRREAVSLLENAILTKNGYRPEQRSGNIHSEAETVEANSGCAVRGKVWGDISDKESVSVALRSFFQLTALAQGGFRPNRLYVDGDLLFTREAQTLALCESFASEGRIQEIILALPYILREADTCYLQKLYTLVMEYPQIFKGFLVRSLEGLGFLRQKAYNGAVYTDAGVYVWNRASYEELCRAGSITGFCLPFELKAGEQRQLLDLPCEKIVYGRIPMMITANCLAKTTDRCRKAEGCITLIDRCNTAFPVLLSCTHCMNIIYNSVPLSLHDALSKWRGKCGLRFDFTIETGDEMKEILNLFADTVPNPGYAYTTGHEKRGVL